MDVGGANLGCDSFHFDTTQTFLGDTKSERQHPYDVVVFYLKYPRDALKFERYMEEFAYVRHRFLKFENQFFAPAFLMRHNLAMLTETSSMNDGRTKTAVRNIFGVEIGILNLANIIYAKINPENKPTVRLAGSGLEGVIGEEEFA
jgi:hypothetical protein